LVWNESFADFAHCVLRIACYGWGRRTRVFPRSFFCFGGDYGCEFCGGRVLGLFAFRGCGDPVGIGTGRGPGGDGSVVAHYDGISAAAARSRFLNGSVADPISLRQAWMRLKFRKHDVLKRPAPSGVYRFGGTVAMGGGMPPQQVSGGGVPNPVEFARRTLHFYPDRTQERICCRNRRT